MKFYAFDLDPVREDSGNLANGAMRFSFEFEGVKNVEKITNLWNVGKNALDALKSKDINAITLISLVSTIYYDFVRKGVR